MSPSRKALILSCALSGVCWGARCTTVVDPGMPREYENYVAAAERNMPARFDSGELSWVPAPSSKEAAAKLASGQSVRWNINDASLNQRIAAQNGTIIHWIGAIRIPGVKLKDLRPVLEDYGHWDRIYRPMIFECRAGRHEDAPTRSDDVILGLQSTFRFVSVFPQHYAFRAQARIDHSDSTSRDTPALRVHLHASEIRESDSGVPGRSDFLEPYHDHGIMWALNAYWRARQQGSDLYLEFETITLARSVQAFVCKLGFVPVPKSIVSAAMDSLPAESVTVILEGTKAECARRAAQRTGDVTGQ